MEVNARREIAIFVVLVALLSAPFYFILFTGRAWTNLTSHLFMYVPAVAALSPPAASSASASASRGIT